MTWKGLEELAATYYYLSPMGLKVIASKASAAILALSLSYLEIFIDRRVQ